MTEKDKNMIITALYQLKTMDFTCEINGWKYEEIDNLIERIKPKKVLTDAK